jgi:phosphoglucosamine mutase
MEKRIFERTDGIRAKVGQEPLVPKTVRRLGGAISRFFNNGTIIIGRDTRESGDWIAQELQNGLATSGATIIESGIVPTPVLAVMTKLEPSATAGIMITASHNPATDNGIKIFHANGDKLTDGEELEIEKIFFDNWEQNSNSTQLAPKILHNASSLYAGEITNLIGSADLSHANILVDSAAGAAYGFISDLAAQFGIKIQEIGPEPTGKNINANCGALHPEHLSATIQDHPADFGVALDGDGDRIILADDTGRIWDGDRIVAMLAMQLKSQSRLPNNAVVLTEYSNLGAIRYLQQNDITVAKVENGDKEVLKKCHEIGATLGGEVAGHIIYTPWLSSSDGLMMTFLILSILQQTSKKLSDLWPTYENLPSKQWGLEVREKVPLSQIPGWEVAMAEQTAFLGQAGRIFVRYSGTEKKLRILVEATDIAKMQKAGDTLSNLVKKEIGND